MLLKGLIRTLRPYQWYKNLLLFVGLIFSNNLSRQEHYLPVLLGAVFFCLMSGAVYILNDILDQKEDRGHPIKGKRPIASGELSTKSAFAIMLFIVIGCPAASYFLISPGVTYILASYFILFIIYSFVLKYIVILDAFTIGIGFVLRAMAGVLAVDNAHLSWWLIICAFLLALFLAFGKRRADLIKLGDRAKNYRSVYSHYSIFLLDHLITLTAGATLVVYCLYAAASVHNGMLLTIPFVIFGILKYMQLMHIHNLGAEPEKMFQNGYMVATILLWGLTVILILYGKLDIVNDIISF